MLAEIPGAVSDCKPYFHQHVDCLLFHAVNMLVLIGTTTFSFSSVGSRMMIYDSVVRSKLEYTSVALNSPTTADSSKRETMQKKFDIFLK
jgi:hypothetical protein